MCIAGCDKAPVMQVNLKYFENLSPEKIDQILGEVRNTGSEEEK